MKYSVIIPIFNAESTLRRCVDSLLVEKYSDAEILLINDGSKDSSQQICEEYARIYSNVSVQARENGGVSAARNAGLDLAKGEYVVFVDSDDYVMPGFFTVMDQILAEHPSDLIQFSYCVDNGKEKKTHVHNTVSVEGREQIMPYLVNAICRKTINTPCGKLYRRSIVETAKNRFPGGVSVAEDRAFNIKYSMYIQSYHVSSAVLYCVNTENEQSLSRKRHTDLQRQFDTARSYFEHALQEAPLSEREKEQYQRAVNFGECRGIYHEAKLLHQDQVSWTERQKRLGRICDTINGKHMVYPQNRYCALITLPVKLRLTPVIDAIAWKLTH